MGVDSDSRQREELGFGEQSGLFSPFETYITYLRCRPYPGPRPLPLVCMAADSPTLSGYLAPARRECCEIVKICEMSGLGA